MNYSNLAELVHEEGIKQRIKKELESKYLKRINYLVGVNNELTHLLESCEKEKKTFISLADNILLDEIPD